MEMDEYKKGSEVKDKVNGYIFLIHSTKTYTIFGREIKLINLISYDSSVQSRCVTEDEMMNNYIPLGEKNEVSVDYKPDIKQCDEFENPMGEDTENKPDIKQRDEFDEIDDEFENTMDEDTENEPIINDDSDNETNIESAKPRPQNVIVQPENMPKIDIQPDKNGKYPDHIITPNGQKLDIIPFTFVNELVKMIAEATMFIPTDRELIQAFDSYLKKLELNDIFRGFMDGDDTHTIVYDNEFIEYLVDSMDVPPDKEVDIEFISGLLKTAINVYFTPIGVNVESEKEEDVIVIYLKVLGKKMGFYK